MAKNYKKLYEDALKNLKRIKEANRNNNELVDFIEYKYPELKESEDERIRKELLDYLGLRRIVETLTDTKVKEEWIAWLEKQGEQKITNTPKFKVGDFIVHDYCMGRVMELTNDAYLLDTGQGIAFSSEHNAHLWTIQDAKDGDVLEFGDHGGLVVGIVSYVNKTTGKADVNCLLEGNNFKLGNYYALDTIKPHPATKEQRDLLFQKMKEAGYEWDAENKELKKIGQNSTWGEVDAELTNFESALFSAFSDAWQEYLRGEEVNVEKWAREHSAELLEVARKQKPTWSEEDEMMLDRLIKHFDWEGDFRFNKNDCDEAQDWLKSLKDRITLTNKNDFDRGYDVGMSAAKFNQWKPTEEQMKALETAMYDFTQYLEVRTTLKSLYEDLKKEWEE